MQLIILVCFLQLPRDDEILSQKLREEARAIFLQRRGRQLLNNNELKVCMETECFPCLYSVHWLIHSTLKTA